MAELLSRTRSRTLGPEQPGARGSRSFLVMALRGDAPLAMPWRQELTGVDTVLLGRGSPGGIERAPTGPATRLSVTVPDRWMSQAHARITTSFGRFLLEDAGAKNGVLVAGKPVKRHELADRDVFELGHTFFVFRSVPAAALDSVPDAEWQALPDQPGLATLVPELAVLFANIVRLASTQVPILVLGESGTGKELLARAIHALSGRAGELVAVNCGALPEALVESELFGHREGAFSGATGRATGLVRAADRGTLFLDEIGDLRLSSQAALLRVLQEGEVRPVGDSRSVKVDIRPVAATHQDLARAMEQGLFRRDLHARLDGFRVELPPVRERIEDRGLLVRALLFALAPGRARTLSFDSEAARALFHHDWPLNVRELENCLRAALSLARDSVITLAHLPASVKEPARPVDALARESPGQDSSAAPPARPSPAPLSEVQEEIRDQLVLLLVEHRGNLTGVAHAMGKARRQIQRWIKRFGLDAESYR